jgi:hypothetical protein
VSFIAALERSGATVGSSSAPGSSSSFERREGPEKDEGHGRDATELTGYFSLLAESWDERIPLTPDCHQT